MSDLKYPTKEQYKELDELMTYILDEMWGVDDKSLIREGIIAYATKWHEIQANGVATGEKQCNLPVVSDTVLCYCCEEVAEYHFCEKCLDVHNDRISTGR